MSGSLLPSPFSERGFPDTPPSQGMSGDDNLAAVGWGGVSQPPPSSGGGGCPNPPFLLGGGGSNPPPPPPHRWGEGISDPPNPSFPDNFPMQSTPGIPPWTLALRFASDPQFASAVSRRPGGWVLLGGRPGSLLFKGRQPPPGGVPSPPLGWGGVSPDPLVLPRSHPSVSKTIRIDVFYVVQIRANILIANHVDSLKNSCDITIFPPSLQKWQWLHCVCRIEADCKLGT